MFKKNTTILFQGDSITDAGRSRDDLNHTMGQGYAFLVAARLGAELPDRGLRFVNRGCNGDRVVDMQARWGEDAISIAPDVISILVGVNDSGTTSTLNTGVPADQYKKIYRSILEETLRALPDVRFVLCDPFLLPVCEKEDRWKWDEWRAEVDKRGEVVARLAEEFEAIHVRNQEAFDKVSEHPSPDYWLWDGVHPMPAGHELLAKTWISAVKSCSKD